MSYLKIHLHFIAWVILTTLSFAPFNLPFIWISYVPLIMMCYQLPLKKLVFFGFGYGFLYYFSTLYWLLAFHKLSVLFVQPICSMYTVIILLLSKYASVVYPKFRIAYFPIFWTCFEIFRAFGFIGFRWNTPADALWQQLVFLQSADLIGDNGVTLLILLVNSGFAELFLSKQKEGSFKRAIIKNYLPLYSVLFLFLCNLAYGLTSMKHWKEIIDTKLKRQSIALMQPNRPPHKSWFENKDELVNKYINMVNSITNQKPDLILQTEIMIPEYFWRGLEVFPPEDPRIAHSQLFLDQAKELKIPMILTHYGVDDQRRFYNSASLIHYTNNVLQTNMYNKIHIVPFGEWVPGSQNWKWLNEILSKIGAAWASAGEKFTIFTGLENIKFAMLICFEDLYAILGRIFVDKGAQYFVNSTNDGWAYQSKIGSKTPLWQHMANTVQTSISLRRSIARSVNTGISGVIDPMGRVDIAPIKEYEEGIHVAEIAVMPGGYRSRYVAYGWIFQYIIFFTAISIALIVFMRDKNSKELKKIL